MSKTAELSYISDYSVDFISLCNQHSGLLIKSFFGLTANIYMRI